MSVSRKPSGKSRNEIRSHRSGLSLWQIKNKRTDHEHRAQRFPAFASFWVLKSRQSMSWSMTAGRSFSFGSVFIRMLPARWGPADSSHMHTAIIVYPHKSPFCLPQEGIFCRTEIFFYGKARKADPAAVLFGKEKNARRTVGRLNLKQGSKNLEFQPMVGSKNLFIRLYWIQTDR